MNVNPICPRGGKIVLWIALGVVVIGPVAEHRRDGEERCCNDDGAGERAAGPVADDVSDDADAYELRVAGPALRQLGRLPEGTVAAITEFMLSALVENPHRIGGRLQRELAVLHCARRGACRVVYEIDDDQHGRDRVAHRPPIQRLPITLKPE